MTDIPSANELHDWLHELPAGHVEEIIRRDDEENVWQSFQLTCSEAVLVVRLQRSGSPPLDLTAVAPLYDEPEHSADTPDFDSAFYQALISAPGTAQTVEATHSMAVDDQRSVLLRYPVYEDGVSKHRVLTTLLELSDAAGFARKLFPEVE